MRTLLTVAMLVGATALAGAQERLADQLRKGIVQEEANQNLDKAIQAYQAIVAQFDEERKTAATALFRLAECYRKAGKREQAVAAYQRVVREFSDQASIVEPSRRQLATTFGVSDVRTAPPARPPAYGREVRQQTLENLQREKATVEERLAATEQRIKAGVVSRESAEYLQLRRELEAARRQIEISRASEMPPERPRDWTQRSMGSPEETRLEMELLEKRLADLQKKIEIGLAAPLDYQQLQTQYLMAKQRYQQQLNEREGSERNAREARLLAQRMIKSVEEEIVLVQERIVGIEKKVAAGLMTREDPELLQLRRDLLGLQRKLEELKAGLKR